jgi:hypothetical protein
MEVLICSIQLNVMFHKLIKLSYMAGGFMAHLTDNAITQ